MRVTPESMCMAIDFIQNAHEQSPSYTQRKLPSGEIVGIAERAACCWNLGQEFMTIKPVNEGTVK